jgi:hypothetical protein
MQAIQPVSRVLVNTSAHQDNNRQVSIFLSKILFLILNITYYIA